MDFCLRNDEIVEKSEWDKVGDYYASILRWDTEPSPVLLSGIIIFKVKIPFSALKMAWPPCLSASAAMLREPNPCPLKSRPPNSVVPW